MTQQLALPKIYNIVSLIAPAKLCLKKGDSNPLEKCFCGCRIEKMRHAATNMKEAGRSVDPNSIQNVFNIPESEKFQ